MVKLVELVELVVGLPVGGCGRRRGGGDRWGRRRRVEEASLLMGMVVREREVGVVGAPARVAAASASTARQIEGIAFVFAVDLGKEAVSYHSWRLTKSSEMDSYHASLFSC